MPVSQPRRKPFLAAKETIQRGTFSNRALASFLAALPVIVGLVVAMLALVWYLLIREIVLCPQVRLDANETSVSPIIDMVAILFACCLILPLLFLTRLGSFRSLESVSMEANNDPATGVRPSLFGSYNHRETDEIIFEVNFHLYQK